MHASKVTICTAIQDSHSVSSQDVACNSPLTCFQWPLLACPTALQDMLLISSASPGVFPAAGRVAVASRHQPVTAVCTHGLMLLLISSASPGVFSAAGRVAVTSRHQPVTAVSHTRSDAVSNLEEHEAPHQCPAHQVCAASHVLQ